MNSSPAIIAIALGSNHGDRHAHLAFALRRLTETFGPLAQSSIYETEPYGVSVVQPAFLNMAVVATTEAAPGEVVRRLLAIEAERGRQRPFPNAPRTLDLDLILHGGTVIEVPHVSVPHPRFRDRTFVLEPLAEIAPELRDPVTGLTIEELWRRARLR